MGISTWSVHLKLEHLSIRKVNHWLTGRLKDLCQPNPLSPNIVKTTVFRWQLQTGHSPAEDAEHEVEHEEGSDDDKWDKVDPIEQTPQSVVSLEHTKYLDE